MGTGYTRNDTVNNIADGNVINASDLDGEFDALQSAFDAATGHTHDGTTAEGAPITVTGPAQEYVSTNTELRPKANNTYDLGSASNQWKDLYVDGTANLDSVDIDAGTIDGTTIGGTSAAAGTFTTATATTGNITTVNATTVDTTNIEVTNLKAKDGTTAGSIADSTGVVTLASSVLTTADINGGTIDGVTIGGASAGAGTFTTLITTGNVTLGNAATDTVTITADVASNIIPSADDTYDLGAVGSEWKNLYIDGTANIDSLVADTADINGGTIDGVTIGGASAGAGTFTTVTMSGNLTVNGNTTLGNAATDTVTITADVASHIIPSADNTYDLGDVLFEWRNLYIDGTANIDNLAADAATISGNLTVNGNTTLGNAATDTVTITADVASNVIPSADNTYDLGAVGSEWKDLYIDGTANIDSLVADSADINGGTIDGATIGGASAAAGTFTTLTATGNVTLGNAATDTVTITADVASNVIPSVDNTYDLGAVGSEWKDLYIDGTANIDSLVADTADINAGTIDGVTLGTNSAVTEAQIDNININGNTISSTNTDGDIALDPNGTGNVVVSSGSLQVDDISNAAGTGAPDFPNGVSVNSNPIATAGSLSNRNKIINGNFDIWQRGTSGTSGYVADRWGTFLVGSTAAISRQSFTLGQTFVPNEPSYFHRTVVTSVAGSNNFVVLAHRLESVRTFAGQEVTLSFWAIADGNKNIAVEFEQNFGTGGSPSAAISTIGVTTCSLANFWQKFTVTVSIPSISGKTLGTNGDDQLTLIFWFDAGSSFNSRTNSLGQQSGTFDIAQVQLEAGDVATPFEIRSVGQELALCQRYYEVLQGSITGGFDANVNIHNSIWPFKVRKRVAPTMTWVSSAVAGRGAGLDFATVLNDANDRSKIGSGTSADAEL